MALPALFPPCFIFREVGPVIIHGEEQENILVVSADGLIKCSNGSKNCRFNCCAQFGDKPIPVEIKCPYNHDNPYYEKYYTIPEIYVPQVTSEMCAFSSDKLLLATKSENSIILKYIENNEYTWELESEILLDFYGQINRKKPTKFHTKRKDLKEQVKLFSKFCCDVFVELPLLYGSEMVQND